MHIWPKAVLHVDGDAFFASVIQAVYPHLKGKPIATGSERGVAIAVSYEAKRLGVKRCMPAWEIKKICPDCIMVKSDFKLYHIFSKRMYDIVREFSPIVEEYSIDEAFADITDLPRIYKLGYQKIGEIIKIKIEESLGITVSIGISTTKSLAKIGSNYKKPSGLVVIEPNDTSILKKLPAQNIWGIGHQINNRLQELNIRTAFDYISHSEAFIKKYLSKPYLEIWRELQGVMVYKIDPEIKSEYKSISKVTTFKPTRDKDTLWAKLTDRVEEAFQKARKYDYDVGKLGIFLKTQRFTFHAIELKIAEKTAYPYLIKEKLKEGFLKIYKSDTLYRATGCNLYDFEETTCHQSSLFGEKDALAEKMKKIYPLYEKGLVSFGTSLFEKNRYVKKDRFRIPMVELS